MNDTKNFGEKMHLMGQIQALLHTELLIMQERKELESKLLTLKSLESTNEQN